MNQEELNKKVDDFTKKYSGKTKGYPTDSYYQGECLSIVKLFIKETFGINPPPSGSNSAFGYWSNFPNPLNEVFDRVPLTASEKPFKGCLPIWNTNVGLGYGHFDIFLEGDNNNFKGFDQNWSGRQAHVQEHNYSNVVGYLKPRLENIQESMEITLQTRIPQIDNKEVQAIISDMNAKDNEINNLRSDLVRLESKLKGECDKRVEVLRASMETENKENVENAIKDYKDRLKTANLEYEKLLIRKVKDFGSGALFTLALKKFFGLA